MVFADGLMPVMRHIDINKSIRLLLRLNYEMTSTIFQQFTLNQFSNGSIFPQTQM